MKLRFLIRTVVIVSVLLLCTGLGVYSFFRLTAEERRSEFNLYSLVPDDAMAVLETDRMADLVHDINQLQCSKDRHFLYISDIFVFLKKHLSVLLADTPHGLSRQMDKMLISFHHPNIPLNQVFYCSLGGGDYELVESLIRKYTDETYPPKDFTYQGEKIRIYPMTDGRFLSLYLTRDFLVLSFQKRLVEEVIDARRLHRSLLQQPAFSGVRAGEHVNVAATLYVRMHSVEMGNPVDSLCATTRLGEWTEFDMKFNDHAVYCSGVSYEVDSAQTFINALRRQQAIEGFLGSHLPASTFYFNRWALSDRASMLGFIASPHYSLSASSSDSLAVADEWREFFNQGGSESVMVCLFASQDTVAATPHAVMRIPVRDEVEAERRLRQIAMQASGSSHLSVGFQMQGGRCRQYELPINFLFSRLSGLSSSPSSSMYAGFYGGALLLAPDVFSIPAYVAQMKAGSVLEGHSLYEECIGSLSPFYNFMMMADMETVLRQPEKYVQLVPNFFFRQASFFRHFMLAVQFSCAEGVVYPNVVLLYKG